MLKCNNCYAFFSEPQKTLGADACPNCKSHSFREMTTNEEEKITKEMQHSIQQARKELNQLNERVYNKDSITPNFITGMSVANQDKPPIIHICPFCNHHNKFLIRTEIYGCEKCKNSISELDWEKVVEDIEGIKYYHLKDKGLTDFEKVGMKIGKLLNRKNRDYGNAFIDGTRFMELLFPNGIPVSKYSDVLLLIRIFDKMKRIATVNKHEDIESPFEDIAGYGILGDSIWND